MANSAKHLIPTLLLALLLVAPGFAGSTDFNASASFLIHNRWIHAHGCSVNGMLLTSAHNIDPRDASEQLLPIPPMWFRYEFRGLNGGIARAVGIVQSADVAKLAIVGSPPAMAELGPSPKKSDRIRWVEYDWRKRGQYMDPRGREAKVVGIHAGMVVLDRSVTNGASGGCAFNDAGQAIGLMTWYAKTDDGDEDKTDEEKVGGVIGFWGGWWTTLRLPK